MKQQERSDSWQEQFVTSTDGTTKVIVQVRDSVYFALNNSFVKTVEADLRGSRIMGLELSNRDDINSLNNDPNVISIEPDFNVKIFDDQVINNDSVNIMKQTVPYGVDMVLQDRNKLKKKRAKGKVKVCVADTGYDINHKDLPKSYVNGTSRIEEKWDYDGNSHGTHVAGIIAGLGTNGKGIYGVIPHDYKGNFELIIVKAFDKSGSAYNSAVIEAVEDCVTQGANVISMSLGCSGCYTIAIDNYFQSLFDNDIILVAAAGNDGNSDHSYPASYKSVISVASIRSNKKRSSFSQYNNQVELSAPGSSVYSTVPRGRYSYKSGTSMSTPYVAGVAGLLMMFFPKCTSAQIRNVMAYTAQDLGSSGCDVKTGFGLVQADDAFERLKISKCGSLEGTPTGGCYNLNNKLKRKGKRNKRRRYL